MKGQISLLVSMAALVVIIALLLAFFGASNPGRQVALANSQALALAIEGVCLTGEARQVNFTLPQAEPPTALGLAPGVLPGLFIKSNGDPNYILSYENVPPAEGLGWEPLAQLGKRVIWPVTGLDGASVDELKARMNALREFLGAGIIVPNVVLGDNNITGDVGRWRGDLYNFEQDISTIPALERSAIKYRSCGADALCLKTPQEILRFPLPTCEAQGIRHIGLESDYLGLLTGLLERPDFYLASPCTANLLVERATCECSDIEAGGLTAFVEDEGEQVLSWPLYAAEDGVLKKLKDKKFCGQRLKPKDKRGALVTGEDKIDCILVYVQDWAGFCATQDKKTHVTLAGAAAGLLTGGISGLLGGAQLNALASSQLSKAQAIEKAWDLGEDVEEGLKDAAKLTKLGRGVRWVSTRALATGFVALLAGIGVAALVDAERPVWDNTDYLPNIGAFLIDDTNLTIGLADPVAAIWLWP
jgi:hypothetical protein